MATRKSELKRLPQRLAQQISSGQVLSCHTEWPFRFVAPLCPFIMDNTKVVVEPASVVKELVENALDASGTSICVTVRVSDEGFNSIEVSDNGVLSIVGRYLNADQFACVRAWDKCG